MTHLYDIHEVRLTGPATAILVGRSSFTPPSVRATVPSA